MNSDQQDKQFIQQAKARLDQAEQQLEPTIKAQLRDARQQALATKQRPTWLMPATAFASITFCALLINGFLPGNKALPPSVDLFEDIALLSAPEALEMYEDLELILWLLEEEAENELG